jgi:prepilin-type N-terminal cleavage/methylation domain-containing protein
LRRSRAGSHAAQRGGFTLIEMLVVTAIIVVILGVIFSSQNSFNRTFVLSNTAYDVALALRNAETYGITSRGIGSDANIGYGLHFDDTSSNWTKSFIFFTDTNPVSTTGCHPAPLGLTTTPDAKPGNCMYDAPGEYLSTYNVNNGVTISDFCVLQSTTWSCAKSHGSTLTWMDIVFSRPDAQPFFSSSKTGGWSSSYAQACVSLTAPNATNPRYVSVSASGEINPTAACCGAACP